MLLIQNLPNKTYQYHPGDLYLQCSIGNSSLLVPSVYCLYYVGLENCIPICQLLSHSTMEGGHR